MLLEVALNTMQYLQGKCIAVKHIKLTLGKEDLNGHLLRKALHMHTIASKKT